MDVSETPTLPPAGSAKQSAAATVVATAPNDHGHAMAKGSFHNYLDQILQTRELSGRSNLKYQCKPLLTALYFLMQGPSEVSNSLSSIKKEFKN